MGLFATFMGKMAQNRDKLGGRSHVIFDLVRLPM
jgi:hypothetical protein